MGWQAGTCTTDVPICSVDTPSQFFTQAAGHPPVGFTQIIVRHETNPLELKFEKPVGNLKTVLVDLPKGMSVDPQAAPQCVLENGKFPSGGCPADSKVGYSEVTASLLNIVPSPPLTFPVYNIAPRPGEPARFGFNLDLGGLGLVDLGEVFLNAGVNWDGDYHEYFTIHVPQVPGGVARILKDRLVFDGTTESQAGGGKFLTTPSTCGSPEGNTTYDTFLHADSYEESAPDDEYDVSGPAVPPASYVNGSQALDSPLPRKPPNSGPREQPTGCGNVPFQPTTSAAPGTAAVDSPAGATVNVGTPFNPTASIYQSNVRDANVSLPVGMGINPASAPTLNTCSDDQFGKGKRTPVACPANSKIGTVAINTPPLPNGTLTGNVYLGTQLSRNPLSGDEYRIFIDAESAARGLSIRLLGNIVANPTTGQLTAVVKEGAAAAVHPGQHPAERRRTGDANQPADLRAESHHPRDDRLVGLSRQRRGRQRLHADDPARWRCLSENDGRTPLRSWPQREAGQRQSTRLHAPRRPDHAAAGAAGAERHRRHAAARGDREARRRPLLLQSRHRQNRRTSGGEREENPICDSNSLVGTATIEAGTGNKPLSIDGKVYLAGPYKGAPLSLVVVTPAIAGPFDLGTVVVRVALSLDPETAQVHPVGEVPDVYGGTKLDVRSILVNLNRKEFTLNGTNCRQSATTGVLHGGGADPTNPAAWSSASVSVPFQGSGCKGLKFRPRLNLRLYGQHRRASNPKLVATLKARAGDANIGRASVALPHALFLDQASLAKICTRVKFSAGECPKSSIYGHAKAWTPLLGKPLEGPVYLRSSNNLLPDLVAHLEGQVTIDLVGKIDSYKGGIRTTFARVPDVPVSKFVMSLPGGKHGLLESSTNLCAKPVLGIIQLKGQNGRKANKHVQVKTPCKKARKGKHRKHRAHR